jgi:glycosyltransferase involved in cell wall biosynthesis
MGIPGRVLLVEMNEDGTDGGSHQSLFDLATRLDRRAFQPSVLFYEENRFADYLRDEGVIVHIWKAQRDLEKERWFRTGIPRKANAAWKTLGAIMRRFRLLRNERLDLVHLNNSPCVGFDDWLPAARLARVPITCHSRGPYSGPTKGFGRWLTRRFDAYVAISQYSASDLAVNGVPTARIHQIYNGIDLGRWKSASADEVRETRAEQGVPDDAFLVILVGLIRSWKGQAVALDAIRQLASEHRRGLRLWIVGGVPACETTYGQALRRQAAEAGLEDTVTFFGHRSDVPRLMAAADVVLHTSTEPEPFGRVVIEGLALGKTVVASQLGAPSEILRTGEGLLFNPARSEDLAAILRDLILDPAWRFRLGERATKRAAMFDVQRTVGAIVQVWLEVLSRTRATRKPPIYMDTAPTG